MCEFTVYLEHGGTRKKIARGVVKAKLKENAVILMDSGGNLTGVEDASIRVVDTLTQELVLKKEQ